NPGKVIDSYGQLADLRLGPDYNPPAPKTHFHYMDDDDKGSFARATLRCVGVGNCRQHEGGTMCPSYMVTREEKDSTRGRAHLLFEMLNGNVIKDGWNDEYVKESLDLCLACKGCKGDCPVNVDIATLKSEFLSHYYEKNRRPASAFAFGWIYWWSRLASVIPGIVNFVTHAPVLKNILKSSVGVTQKRTIPSFAQQTFRNWFGKQQKKNTDKPKVILWVDTWNNFFKPETLVAALEVLEAAGFQVIISQRVICCGRPLYDFGMLDKAKEMLLQILDTLRDEIREGTPVVGLEPSCVSVFRDEMCDLIRGNEDAKRLKKQTFTLAEFLEKKAPDFKIPKLKRNAIVQAHCHHRAIMKIDSEENLLKKIGLDYQILDSGCCGMAGYFGYLKGDKYDVSVAAGERVMLPAVRGADKKTLVISNGYSCREQIEQLTDREGMHIAQVLQMALHENERADSEATNYPERKYVDDMKIHSAGLTLKRTIVALSVIGLVAFSCLLMSKKKSKRVKKYGRE
ncbi:MAG: (Fe-S)-binding protein, partial [Ginsengibacter sp.]